MLEHSIARVARRSPDIERVFVVVAPPMKSRIVSCRIRRGSSFCAVGGATRAASVRNGLRACARLHHMRRRSRLLVHDAARPCLAREELAHLIDAVAATRPAGLLAMPVADTLKRAENGWSLQTVRSRRIVVRTNAADVSRRDCLRARSIRRTAPQRDITDEASAIEGLDLHPRLIEGHATNIKVTTSGLDAGARDPALTGTLMMKIRVGSGFDVHALVPGRRLVLGGVEIASHARGLLGHSDADVLLHAITDAVLGAAGLGDIGAAVSRYDERWRGADSRVLLQRGASVFAPPAGASKTSTHGHRRATEDRAARGGDAGDDRADVAWMPAPSASKARRREDSVSPAAAKASPPWPPCC